MRSNPVKKSIQSSGTSLGSFVLEFNTTGLARLAAGAGAEFLIYDMEHTGWSMETIRGLLATTPETLVPIVRVPATEYHFIARVLDMGAMGVMLPMVESVEQAEAIVQYAKYPPMGRRGCAFGIAHDGYRGGDLQKTAASANRELILIAQIETAAGLENAEAIARVEGIDSLWVGQADLTISLGILGQFDDPRFTGALDQVVAACDRHGKAAGFLAMNPDEAMTRIQSGFRIIAMGGDLWLYQSALRSSLKAVRDRLE